MQFHLMQMYQKYETTDRGKLAGYTSAKDNDYYTHTMR